jgi:hypothetical protein
LSNPQGLSLPQHPSSRRSQQVVLPGRFVSDLVSHLCLTGFCAVSKTLPLPAVTEPEIATQIVKANGLCAEFSQKVFCVAAEPHTTFIRVGVDDAVQHQEVAYATAVLGRLKPGYRVLPLRSALGTRIDCCYLLVRISVGSLENLWPSPRQVWPCTRAAPISSLARTSHQEVPYHFCSTNACLRAICPRALCRCA